MKRKVLVLFTLLLTICMAIGLSVKAEAAGAVKLDRTKLVLEIGQGDQLMLMNTTKTVKWSSSDEDVVEVDDEGNLTAIGVGAAKVTAKAGTKKYTCKVTVADYTDMSDEQKAVVSFALQYVGNKYVYGGASLTKGADCSGFTMAVYKKFGYSLPHNAYSQLVSKSVKKVNVKKIKPGDLIFYGTSKRNCSHVGIYIGDEKVIHASTASTGIIISDYMYRKCVGVGRVLKTETYSDPTMPQDDSTTRLASPAK